MAELHVVSALKDKHAELSGIITDLEKQLNQHRADLLHVAAVLHLFAPEIEPKTIRPTALRRRSEWFKPGDLARMVLDILRLASTPLSIKDITVQVMQRRGLDPADARTTQLMRKLIHNALNRQAAELVEKVAEDGVVAWRVRD
jgi:hypothetical protein